jgi:hypothetical protein
MSRFSPIVVEDAEQARWDDVADVVVVGLGAAGVSVVPKESPHEDERPAHP